MRYTNRPIFALSDLYGASELLWSIWLFKNEGIFFIKNDYNVICRLFLEQLIESVFGTLCKKKNDKPFLKWACRMMETMVVEIFAKHGWPPLKRLDV